MTDNGSQFVPWQILQREYLHGSIFKMPLLSAATNAPQKRTIKGSEMLVDYEYTYYEHPDRDGYTIEWRKLSEQEMDAKNGVYKWVKM